MCAWWIRAAIHRPRSSGCKQKGVSRRGLLYKVSSVLEKWTLCRSAGLTSRATLQKRPPRGQGGPQEALSPCWPCPKNTPCMHQGCLLELPDQGHRTPRVHLLLVSPAYEPETLTLWKCWVPGAWRPLLLGGHAEEGLCFYHFHHTRFRSRLSHPGTHPSSAFPMGC